MSPAFCPANGQLDLSRLRLVFDDIPFNAGFVATVMQGIQAWVPMLGVAIVNLNLTQAAAASDYVLLAGNGTQARAPNNLLRISYITANGGYLFFTDPARSISHEFGHLLGLADRYYEGYQHTPTVVGSRITVPMDGRLFSAESDYVPATNLMSGSGLPWSLTNAQRQLILACTDEGQLSRRVVGLFDSTQTSGSWSLPPTMYLGDDGLYTPDPPPPDLAIAGYTLLGGLVFKAKASATLLKNKAVRDLWDLRPAPGVPGTPIKKTWFRRGKQYRSRRIVSTGPRIHRQMMRAIGSLAGS
jgi:hypothetical protein